MDGPETQYKRIMVVARPALGRFVEDMLRRAEFEVHRTPATHDLSGLVTRLRPNLVILALDLPWADALDAAGTLTSAERPLPVLLLGDALVDPRIDGVPRLPLPVDPRLLVATVDRLIAANDGHHGG